MSFGGLLEECRYRRQSGAGAVTQADSCSVGTRAEVRAATQQQVAVAAARTWGTDTVVAIAATLRRQFVCVEGIYEVRAAVHKFVAQGCQDVDPVVEEVNSYGGLLFESNCLRVTIYSIINTRG